jgi:mono/diheme cytochrome c family protein
MKNGAMALVAILVVAGISAGVVYADLKKGYYAPAPSSGVPQPAWPALSPDASYEVSSYPVPSLELAPDEGRAEVQIYCNTCHSPRYITMQPPLPAATWEAEVNKMNKAMGAGIPEDAARKIVSYLQAHYTPETRKP